MLEYPKSKKEAPLLVSACLAGIPCRYNGQATPNAEVMQLVQLGQAIPVCPEMLEGLSTPRVAVELKDNRALGEKGEDFTFEFHMGAEETLKIAQKWGCKQALLKSGSPSCGYGKIYDGSFTGKMKKGNGITAELLHTNGIEITAL